MTEEKLHEDDEGALNITVVIKDGHVIVDFGKPVKWIGLHANNAEELGNSLLKKAKKLREGG